jgi:N utilization substance protein B
MKSSSDPRHKKRRSIVQQLFAQSFTTSQPNPLASNIFEKRDELDEIIGKSAPQWPVDKLNKIDLAILRLATYELIYSETPAKVIVDEAVELAKEFGSETTSSFINGVLGDIIKKGHTKVTK